jgi:hypothetical protein
MKKPPVVEKPVCTCPKESLVDFKGINHKGEQMYFCKKHQAHRSFPVKGEK